MVVLFSYTNGAYEFCVDFCVVEVFKFWVRIRWNMYLGDIRVLVDLCLKVLF